MFWQIFFDSVVLITAIMVIAWIVVKLKPNPDQDS